MKYDVKMSCGHKQTVVLYGPGKDRERKIWWYENRGMCTECYKKHMAAKNKEMGLIFQGSVLPYTTADGQTLVSVWFSGDTWTHRDEIKALGGYVWGDREAAEDFYKYTRCGKVWKQTIKKEEFPEKAKQAASIGAKIKKTGGLYEMIHRQMATEREKENSQNR